MAKKCHFCQDGIKVVDYKKIAALRPHVTSFNRIQARRYSNLCLNHQKQMAKAVKNARIVGLLPFVP